ncbi:MAG: flagellar hook capping FlgD N-terminal domain-containing protein [Pseudomonadota bacterium]
MEITNLLPPDFQTLPSDLANPQIESDEDTFLTLLLTQLENQDPLNPQDNSEFLSQLASFETATGISDLNASFADLAASLTTNTALESAALVDRDVITQTTTAALEDGEAVEGRIPLSGQVDALFVEIADATGAVVRRMPVELQGSAAQFEWDGRDDGGDRLDDGNYTVSAVAERDGETVVFPVELATRVESVLIGGGGEAQLVLANGDTVPMSSVREIS